MRIDVLTLFPNMILPVIKESIIGRAIYEQKITINVIDFRAFSTNKHKKVDDTPYGGGAGMVLTAQPIVSALESIHGYQEATKILMTPQGKQFAQTDAQTLSEKKHIILLCGHYEGYDERIRAYFDLEISIGDYVLTGGELSALVVIDSVIRLIPNVLNNEESASEDSFSNGLLEYPQYTRPPVFRGQAVPDVLTSGNHQKIKDWRKDQSIKRTRERRPDLYEKYLKNE